MQEKLSNELSNRTDAIIANLEKDLKAESNDLKTYLDDKTRELEDSLSECVKRLEERFKEEFEHIKEMLTQHSARGYVEHIAELLCPYCSATRKSKQLNNEQYQCLSCLLPFSPGESARTKAILGKLECNKNGDYVIAAYPNGAIAGKSHVLIIDIDSSVVNDLRSALKQSPSLSCRINVFSRSAIEGQWTKDTVILVCNDCKKVKDEFISVLIAQLNPRKVVLGGQIQRSSSGDAFFGCYNFEYNSDSKTFERRDS